jgi:hypothetical protein
MTAQFGDKFVQRTKSVSTFLHIYYSRNTVIMYLEVSDNIYNIYI